MSRTLNQIQEQILSMKNRSSDLSALEVLTPDEQTSLTPDSTSKVAEWRRTVWVVAVVIWFLEKLFDIFRQEIEDRIAATRPHTRGWYREKALAFQNGYTLPDDKDYYNTIDESAKIVKYASIRKLILSGRGTLVVKIAKDDSGNLAPLTATERYAFTSYMNRVTDAGTFISVRSYPADSIKIEADVYYNPEIVDSDGNYIATGEGTVIPAIDDYLKNMDFDTQLILTKLVDAIQKVEGISYPVLKKVEVKTATGSWEPVYDISAGVHKEFSVPDAGWYELDEANTVINYIKLEE